MNKTLISFAALLITFSAQATIYCYDRWEPSFDSGDIGYSYYTMIGKCDYELREDLHNRVKEKHTSHRYGDATKKMYRNFDVYDNKVCSVYSPGECNTLGKPKDYSLNCEHTWPRSKGAKQYPAKSDLHHLYPTTKEVNEKRASYPFCDVDKVYWEHGGSKLGLANSSTVCFEPPEEHKGNVARSMFYFAIRYSMFIDADQEETFRRWHKEDPVDRKDLRRNRKIQEFQGNRNPFIDQPYLVDLISDF